MALSGPIGVLTTLSAPLLPLLLKSLQDEGVDDVCVIADQKLLSAKDQRIWSERTNGAFDSLGISLYDFGAGKLPFYLVQNHNGPDCMQLLEQIRPRLLINGGTPRKLGKQILEATPQGVLNVHPGLLPKYRGASCVEWAIYNDDEVGNTAHFMTEEYDAGPIIATEACSFSPNDDYVSMRVQVYRRAIAMMARTVRQLVDTGVTPAQGQQQGEGMLFSPIGDEEMKTVLDKIASATYCHMNGKQS